MSARRRPTRRATLRDIAESLDLSVNTVSRALAGKDGLGEATRQRVQDEADRLGYVPNTAARSLVAGHAQTIGLVITNPANPFYALLIDAVGERCRQHGYALMLMVSEDRVADERRATEELMRWGVDGVLGVPVQHGAEHWQRLRKSGIPLVLLNRTLPDLDADLVAVDHHAGARAAAEHAFACGATDVLLVEESIEVSPVAARIRGFVDVVAEHGLDPVARVRRLPGDREGRPGTPFDPARALALGRELVPDLADGTTVLVGNDYDALGLYRAMAEAGRTCPDELGVVGYGDHPFSAYLSPALTTVRLPAAAVATAGVDRVVELIDDGADTLDPATTLLTPELVVRDSTHPAHDRGGRGR